MFWGMAFPVIMGIIFNVAFGGLSSGEFNPIPVAVVIMDDMAMISTAFYEALPMLSEVMAATVTGYEYAAELLFEREIAGIFLLGYELELVVNSGGVDASILETVANEFSMTAITLGNIVNIDPHGIIAAVEAMQGYTTSMLQLNLQAVGILENFFYVMLAIGCFMGIHLGLESVANLQADMTQVGARVSVSPTSKLRLFAETVVSNTIVQFIMSVAVMLFYMHVLGVEFGERLGLILLACFFSGTMAVTVGMFVAAITPGRLAAKRNIILALCNVFFIAGGMFAIEIRNLIRELVPIFDRLNPIVLISDTFVSLAIRENLDIFIQNSLTMLGITIILCAASGLVLARRRHANL